MIPFPRGRGRKKREGAKAPSLQNSPPGADGRCQERETEQSFDVQAAALTDDDDDPVEVRTVPKRNRREPQPDLWGRGRKKREGG